MPTGSPPIKKTVVPAAPDIPSQVKGSGLIVAIRWLDRSHGRAALARLREKMPVPWRDTINLERKDYGLLAGTWYPAGFINAFYDALTDHLAPGARSTLAHRLGRGIADGLVSGVYRYILSLFVSPEMYVANLARIWRQNWTDGEVAARMVSKKQVEIRLSAWKGHHIFNCEVNNYIAVAIFEKMGIRDVTCTWTCKSVQGGAECVCNFAFPPGV
jgi:hypothetical protein